MLISSGCCRCVCIKALVGELKSSGSSGGVQHSNMEVRWRPHKSATDSFNTEHMGDVTPAPGSSQAPGVLACRGLQGFPISLERLLLSYQQAD